nr:MAG TPA: hypothetical protein [Caudoviricetes sp.]
MTAVQIQPPLDMQPPRLQPRPPEPTDQNRSEVTS